MFGFFKSVKDKITGSDSEVTDEIDSESNIDDESVLSEEDAALAAAEAALISEQEAAANAAADAAAISEQEAAANAAADEEAAKGYPPNIDEELKKKSAADAQKKKDVDDKQTKNQQARRSSESADYDRINAKETSTDMYTKQTKTYPDTKIKPIAGATVKSYEETKAKYSADIEASNKEKELATLKLKGEQTSRDAKAMGSLKGYSERELTKAFSSEYRKAYGYVMGHKENVGDRAELRTIVEEAERFGVDEGLLEQLTKFRKRVEGKTIGAVTGKAIKGTAGMVKAMPRVGASAVRATSGVGRQLSDRGNAMARPYGGTPGGGRVSSGDPTRILDSSLANSFFATPRMKVDGGGIISRTMRNPMTNPMANSQQVSNVPQVGYIGVSRPKSQVSQIIDKSWIKQIAGV